MLLIFIFSFTIVQAQRLDFGAFGGVSNYLGDLSPVAFTVSETHFAGGAILRYSYNKWTATRLNILHGKISGDDANQFKPGLQRRGLSFTSDITEFSVQQEFNLVRFPLFKNSKIIPYIFGGIGIYTFNPVGYSEGQEQELQPLHTEGEDYALAQVSFPFGGGIKYQINDHWLLAVEAGFRKTMTDYLDDVSQRGDPVHKDWYMFIGPVLTFSPDLPSSLKKIRMGKCFEFKKGSK